MRQEAIHNIVSGLKQAGIDFVVTLSCTAVGPLIPYIMRDPQFKHVPVGNESDGIVISAGAWLGGKKPAVLIENTGVVLGAYALTGLDCMYGGFPMLMIVDHRGSFGDGTAYFYFGGGQMAPLVLDGLRIPYTIVRECDKLTAEIVRGQKTAEAYGKPVAVLLSGEEVS
jgi:sulfopyruvate decarboxylase subunit alpha